MHMFIFVNLNEYISYAWNAYSSETGYYVNVGFLIAVTFSDVFILFELFDRKVCAQFLDICNYPWYVYS